MSEEVLAGETFAPQSSDYFERIPRWSAGDSVKRFEIMADGISGRIPVTRLESWREFTDLLESDFYNRLGVQLVFRGHRRHDWSLMPTLGRISSTKGIVSEELALAQLERFRRAVRGRLKDTSLVDVEEADELWAVGQHYGLMTPLLDWTYSPYVALFFAFQKEDSEDEAENPYRALYVLNKTYITEHQEETGIRLWEPRKDEHGRLVSQAGLFTFSPYGNTIENKLTDALTNEDGFDDEDLKNASEDEQPDILARYICKIYIRNTGPDREACLRHLRRMNVHHASLFPDLLGASEYCNILTAEAELEAELQRLAKPTTDTVTVLPIEPVTGVVGAPSAAVGTSNIIEAILRANAEAAQVEPGRIALIAQELAQSLERNQVVDWESRDAAQARLRNAARVILRKLGYPASLRDEVAERVVEMAKPTRGGGEVTEAA
ncbi:FRG domain-containing protein [Cupriavidus taiwanensis]|uniref:FRG domain protein n=1 Tax=Cupriavidus taiwanensis TaxID=164546 RepID=A0A975WRI5_9BURK|nr:FRG domain protein [Cupriavidus taiwanensis]